MKTVIFNLTSIIYYSLFNKPDKLETNVIELVISQKILGFKTFPQNYYP